MSDTLIVIPSYVLEVEDEQYINREDIISVSFPSSLKRIGKKAFYQTPNLRVIDLKEGVEYIDDCAFLFGSKVIYIPKTVKYIGCNVFDNAVIFFEGDKDSFKHYYTVEENNDYPSDYYHRGTDGQGDIITTYYLCY